MHLRHPHVHRSRTPLVFSSEESRKYPAPQRRPWSLAKHPQASSEQMLLSAATRNTAQETLLCESGRSFFGTNFAPSGKRRKPSRTGQHAVDGPSRPPHASALPKRNDAAGPKRERRGPPSPPARDARSRRPLEPGLSPHKRRDGQSLGRRRRRDERRLTATARRTEPAYKSRRLREQLLRYAFTDLSMLTAWLRSGCTHLCAAKRARISPQQRSIA